MNYSRDLTLPLGVAYSFHGEGLLADSFSDYNLIMFPGSFGTGSLKNR
ncbi:hypothetical protein Holit_02545 [Hollandina sp. SP2]